MPITAMIVACELIVAFLLGQTYGFHYRLAFRDYLTIGIAVAALMLLVGFLYLLGRNAIVGAERALDGIFSRKRIEYATSLAIGVLLIAMQMCILGWTKSMIPHIFPMWADPMLAELDRLVLGVDAWKITHAILGPAEWVDQAYIAWGPIKFAMLAFVLALPESSIKAQVIAAYFITLATGCILQYALPSGGPIFFELLGHGDDYAEFAPPPFAAEVREYLWSRFQGSGDVGSGISAMPSIHVTIAMWLALSAWSINKWFGYVGAIYCILVFIGSIHTGFHYASDGVVGVLIGVFGWYVTLWLFRLLPASERIQPLPEAKGPAAQH